MTTPLIPDNAIGRIGMVAALHRVRGEEDGRMVAVRYPVGMVTELIGAASPAFAWQVLVLGEPVELRGKHCREIIVADQCLRPVSQLPQGEVERLVKVQAQIDFDAAIADLATILNAKDIAPDELDAIMVGALNQVQMTRALETVAITQVLQEARFRQCNLPDGDVYEWIGVHNGIKLKLTAGQDWFGQWRIWSEGHSAREIHCGEMLVLTEWPRGKVMQVLAELWTDAFRGAQVPDDFSLGVLYKQHQNDLRRLQPGLPFLEVNGEVLRATRRWLRDAHAVDPAFTGPPVDVPLDLEVKDGLLHLRTPLQVFAVPVRRGWMDECQVSLREFVLLPSWTLRGAWVNIRWSGKEVWFGRADPIPAPR